MKHLITILMLLAVAPLVYAGKISRNYQNVPLSKVLEDLDAVSDSHTIYFIYDELEHFTVTCSFTQLSLDDALRTVVGFYPISISHKGNSYFVECDEKDKHRLTGTIVDEQEHPVAYANIALYSPTDSTLLCSGVSNEGGSFVIPCSRRDVMARITHIGYKTLWLTVGDENAGTIQLQPETYPIEGITVESLTPILRREDGAIVFDTRNVVGAVDATDLLRYAPGVIIDHEALIMPSTDDVTVCINGKELHLWPKELLQVLKTYPAANVEKIVIPPTPGVINLILKANSQDFIGGSATYTHTQYEEHGDELTATVTCNKERLSTSLTIAGTKDNSRHLNSSNFDYQGTIREDHVNGHIHRQDYAVNWQADYRVTDRLTLGTYLIYSDRDRQQDMDTRYSLTEKNSDPTSDIIAQVTQSEHTKTTALNAYATEKLNGGKDKVDLNLDYYSLTLDDDRNCPYMTFTPGHTPIFHSYYYNYSNAISQTIENYSGRVDASIGHFLFGSQFAYTHSNRQSHYDSHINNRNTTFDYDEQVAAIYASYHRQWGKRWTIMATGRYEHTWTKATIYNPLPAAQSDNYGNLSPTLLLSFSPSRSHSLSWSVSSRISRPNIISVNPDTVWTDACHYAYGNEYLKPTCLYKAAMDYSYKGLLSLGLYYVSHKDRIAALSRQTSQQLTISTWGNAVTEKNVGLNAIFHFSMLRWMNASLMSTIDYRETTIAEGASHVPSHLIVALPESRGLSYTGTLHTSLIMDREKKWMALIHLTYRSKETDVTKELSSRYNLDIAMQRNLWRDRFTIALTARHLLASRMKGKEFLGTTTKQFNNKCDYLQFLLTLTYNWGVRQHQERRQHQSDEMRERTINNF